MKVYVVEIYDTTEYYDQIVDLQVFFNFVNAKLYVLREVGKHSSYQSSYVEIRITEWTKGSNLVCSKYYGNGESIYKNGI